MQNRPQLSLFERIRQLKAKQKAIILAHNYQLPEVQDIADYIGDSLGLSRIASSTPAEVIVFCGVRFMAETASILCPDKLVLMPDMDAGCPMADMITATGLRALKKEHPGASVVSYVNTPAEVKAETDICCTSANAVEIIKSLADREEIIFVPDKYLGSYVCAKLKRNLILWDGYCPAHIRILSEDIIRQKKMHPKAEVVVHPECLPEVVNLADAVLSTEGMFRHIKASQAAEVIVGTEIGILHRLKKENPQKEFFPASQLAVCPGMKLTSLEKILWCLEDRKGEINVPQEIRAKAIKSIDRMLDLKPPGKDILPTDE